ncbi:IS110-like element IS621 family transposase [soil metagenome]
MQAELLTETEATETVWIGIDVADQTVDAALHQEGGRGAAAVFPRTPKGMAELAAWARREAGQGANLRAVMEATGRFSTQAIAWLLEADSAIAPACVNPLHAKRFGQSLGVRNKTDRTDARVLARMGAERKPTPYEAPDKLTLELRSLVRERRGLVTERESTRLQIKAGSDSAFVDKQRERRLKELVKAVARMDAEIARVVATDAKMSADVKRLMTIPGVGIVTAVAMLAELGDLRRFTSGRQLAAFAGVSPRRCESGSSVRGRTRMSKQGSPVARAILYMSAVTAKGQGKEMAETYERLLAAGKKPKSALGAIMRKQLVLMRALLVTGKDYEPPVNNLALKEGKTVA